MTPPASELGARLLVAANRFLPAPALPGDADPMDYADWEYDNSVSLAQLWAPVAARYPARALDVGCGLGGKTRRLAEISPDTAWTALDLRPEHVQQAAAYHEQQGVPGIAKVAANVTAMPFPDAAFDAIVTADTLEHFPDPRGALRELRRCLAADGRLVLQFNPWGSPRGSHLGDLLRMPWCQRFASRETLERATILAGEERARRAVGAEEAEAVLRFADGLVHHFHNHLFTVWIRDFRRWIVEDGFLAIDHEILTLPGPLRPMPRIVSRPFEEWTTAAYGAVLIPR